VEARLQVKYDLVIVNNQTATQIPVGGTLEPVGG
jgi:hypothetical protein